MPIVGAFARIETAEAVAIRRRLARIDGVTPFDLDDEGKVGLLIEAPDLESAHAQLTGPIRGTDGVLGVWPVTVDVEDLAGDERAAPS